MRPAWQNNAVNGRHHGVTSINSHQFPPVGATSSPFASTSGTNRDKLHSTALDRVMAMLDGFEVSKFARSVPVWACNRPARGLLATKDSSALVPLRLETCRRQTQVPEYICSLCHHVRRPIALRAASEPPTRRCRTTTRSEPQVITTSQASTPDCSTEASWKDSAP